MNGHRAAEPQPKMAPPTLEVLPLNFRETIARQTAHENRDQQTGGSSFRSHAGLFGWRRLVREFRNAGHTALFVVQFWLFRSGFLGRAEGGSEGPYCLA